MNDEAVPRAAARHAQHGARRSSSHYIKIIHYTTNNTLYNDRRSSV